jgi:hypothetical protein
MAMTMMKKRGGIAMRCDGCGMAIDRWDHIEGHLECLRAEGEAVVAKAAVRMAELVQRAEDILQDIIAQLPRGAQYRRAAVLAKVLEEIRDEAIALQAL